MSPRRILLGLAASALLFGCGGVQGPICEADAVVKGRSVDDMAESHVRSVLLGSRLRETEASSDACTAPKPDSWRVNEGSCISVIASGEGEELGSRESRVHLGRVDSKRHVAWLTETRLPDARLGGRVALVDVAEGRLRVRALGFLAQGEQSPTFDLLTIDGKEFIIARSTRCDAHDTTQCSRSAVPLLVEGERILPVTLESIDGSCGLGASFLVEAMVERATRSGAAELTYGVSLAPEGRALRLRETVRVIERDREGSEIPSATSVIDGELRFHISLRGERWRADRANLLERAGAELGERGR